MARSLFSSSWHSVADLKPRLVPQAKINRHIYRGQVWYVVQDQTGGNFHRLSSAAYAVVLGMDGAQTVQELWEKANTSAHGEDACTQNEVVDLLVQLHAADLLQLDVNPDSAVLFQRYKKKRLATLKQYFLNPMSIKLPLIDPNVFISRWAPHVAWCFGPKGLLLWLAVVLPALMLAGQNWRELTNNFSEQMLSSSNLLVMAFVFPIVKLLHELGHGFATRVWGGAVHEMGLMFLVFAPVPYVNASAASSFPSKTRRAVVAAAGMLVELFLAALALYVWLLVEPGVVRAVAHNVMTIAGISTLIVNGNPLLRYDGYYILSDLIEMPNLAQRGQKYMAYLWDHHVFGAHDLDEPPETEVEKRWLVVYTPLAWCYRTFVTVSIMLFIAGQYFIFGVLIALWGIVTLIFIPLWKAYRHVMRSPTLQRHRARAVRLSSALLAAILLIAFVLPVPLRTRSEGVVWLPDQAIVRAGGKGFFRHWLVEPGRRVRQGDALFELADPLLFTELEVARAKVAEAQAKYRSEQFTDQVKAATSSRQLEQEQSVLAKLEEQAAKLVAYAEADGVLVAEKAQDMPGRYFKKGDLAGYVLEKNALIVRVVVTQDDIDLLRARFRSAQLRFSDWIGNKHDVTLVRQPAGAVDELPTAALGLSGGGLIPTLASDTNGVKTVERVFMVDLSLPPDVPPSAFGERVHVRFSHGWEPLAWQGLRRLRQLLLSRFSV
ncbi:peptidase M50 [Propionivibrio sp.]|uniref:peptidase M50 n=1 Tax=Propionivibrio sp. TaxID=2212460 RepID=UPI002630D6A6|nr:peptidase M50 [Propionivibrio sp.]